MSQPSPVPPARPRLPELFVAFALISLYGVAGVLYWSRRMMVDERKWMSPEAFNEAYALCNFLPGPKIGCAGRFRPPWCRSRLG
jgi:chromate transporter